MKLSNFGIWLVVICLFALGSCQSKQSKKPTVSKSVSKTKKNPYEQGRTLGLLRPLLSLGGLAGLRPLASDPIRPVNSYSRPAVQSDPYYGNSYYGNNYGGYPGYGGYLNIGFNPYINRPSVYAGFRPTYGGYSGYSNYGYNNYPYNNGYQNYGGYPSAGYGSYGGLNNAVSGSNVGLTASAGAAAQPGGQPINTAQAAQVAGILGQALGSSLRPLLAANGGGVAASNGAAGGANALGGLLSLLG